MDKSPVKDIDVNVPPRGYGPEEKFRDMRHRAKEIEETTRSIKKTRRDRRPREYKYKIGDIFVARRDAREHLHFYLVEVLDYKESFSRWGDDYSYYCILRQTTDPDVMGRIGRLVSVGENHNSWYGRELADANVENKKIKWLVTE